MMNGTIISWDDAKGFGFIKPDNESKKVFLHVSAFGKLPKRPQVGDRVYFDTIIEQSGKQKAKIARLVGPDISETTMSNSTMVTGYRQKPGNRTYRQLPVRRLKSTIITICLVAGVVLFIFSQRNSKQETPSVDNAKNMQRSGETPEFKCEGKVYCSEMTSYEEALFYLRHCPGTRIDGDGDGVPCENQFGR